jgi:hypothetical protein
LRPKLKIDQEVDMRARRVVRRRSIARAAVGTAVVAGTAGAVRHHQNKKWAAQDAQQQEQYEQEQYEPEVQYEAPVEQAPEADLTAQLQQLAQLHDSGVLTDEEFAAAKSKLLAG